MDRVARSRLQSQSVSFFASLILALICVLPSQAGTLSVTGGSGFSNPLTVGPNPGPIAQFNAVDTNIPNGITPAWSASVMGAPLGWMITPNGNGSAVVQVGGSNMAPGTYNVTLTVTASYSVPYGGPQTDMGSISFTLNVVGVTMPPSPITVASGGGSQTCNATVIPSGASGITYVSANTSVATVVGSGATFTVTGGSSGTTQISAMYGTTTLGNVTVIVVGATFSPSSLSLYLGQTQGVSVNLNPPSAPVTLTFQSVSPTIASVQGGAGLCSVTGNAVGTTQIKALWNSTTLATLNVTVSAPSITFTPQAVTVFVGQTLNVTPTIIPSSASGQITYTSAMPTIASASGSGTILTVQGNSPGTTQVNAMLAGTSIGFLPVTVNSQPIVAFASASYNVNENAGMVPITVSLTGSSPNTVTVSYATMNGSAIAGTDYTSAMGTLTFAPGVTSQSFNVGIIDKGDFSNQVVSFSIQLSNPSPNLEIGPLSMTTVNITDNDQPPQITVSVNPATTSSSTVLGVAPSPINVTAAASIVPATTNMTLQSCTWSSTVQYSVDGQNWSPGSSYTINFGPAPLTNPSTTSLSATFSTAGYWMVIPHATMVFTDSYGDMLTAASNDQQTPPIIFTVVALQGIQFQMPGGPGFLDVPSQGLYVALGTPVTFKAVTYPPNVSWPAGYAVWSGCGVNNTTGGIITVTFSTPSQSMSNTYTLDCTAGPQMIPTSVVVYPNDVATLDIQWSDTKEYQAIYTMTAQLWVPDTTGTGVPDAMGGEVELDSINWGQLNAPSHPLTERATWSFSNGQTLSNTAWAFNATFFEPWIGIGPYARITPRRPAPLADETEPGVASSVDQNSTEEYVSFHAPPKEPPPPQPTILGELKKLIPANAAKEEAEQVLKQLTDALNKSEVTVSEGAGKIQRPIDKKDYKLKLEVTAFQAKGLPGNVIQRLGLKVLMGFSAKLSVDPGVINTPLNDFYAVYFLASAVRIPELIGAVPPEFPTTVEGVGVGAAPPSLEKGPTQDVILTAPALANPARIMGAVNFATPNKKVFGNFAVTRGIDAETSNKYPNGVLPIWFANPAEGASSLETETEKFGFNPAIKDVLAKAEKEMKQRGFNVTGTEQKGATGTVTFQFQRPGKGFDTDLLFSVRTIEYK